MLPLVVFVLVFTSCEKEEDVQTSENAAEIAVSNDDKVIQMIAKLFTLPENKGVLSNYLQKQTEPVALQVLIEMVHDSENSSFYKAQLNEYLEKVGSESSGIEVPEIRVMNGESGIDFSKALFVDASTYVDGETIVEGSDAKGIQLQLNATSTPEQTVVILDNKGTLSLENHLEAVNRDLEFQGVQTTENYTPGTFAKAAVSSLRLNSIRVRNVQEVGGFFGNTPEIYGVVFYRDSNNNPRIILRNIPIVQAANRTYYPNQTLFSTSSAAPTIAGIVLCEQDTNYSISQTATVIRNYVDSQFRRPGTDRVLYNIVRRTPVRQGASADDLVDGLYRFRFNSGGSRTGDGSNATIGYSYR